MSRSFEFPREMSLLRRFLLLALLALSGCASTPPPQPSSALPAEGTWLARQAEIQGRDHPGQSGFHLLGASEDAFVARAALIRAAQRSLDIQYYIVHDGLTTRALAYELLKAADRGVRVRILIDDTASDGWDYEIGVLSAHPNIQVRLFNPLHLGRATGITRGVGRLFNLSQQHRRMHNKLWLADGTAAIVGGRNLGDEYFNAKPEMNFTDLDLYVYTGAGAGKSEEWLGLWTLFYWAWWISWAPFVGMFIARISRGRSVRELVCGVLLIPLGFTLAWLSVFGNSALDLVMNHGATDLGKAALEQPSMSIYLLLEHYPLSKIVIGLSIFVGFVLFLTPADSGSVMLANLSRSGGELDEDAPNWLRILWSAVVTLVTIGLLFAGNFTAMQTVVVLAGLPFSAVLILFMFGLHKAMRADYEAQVGDRRTYQPVPAPTQHQT